MPRRPSPSIFFHVDLQTRQQCMDCGCCSGLSFRIQATHRNTHESMHHQITNGARNCILAYPRALPPRFVHTFDRDRARTSPGPLALDLNGAHSTLRTISDRPNAPGPTTSRISCLLRPRFEGMIQRFRRGVGTEPAKSRNTGQGRPVAAQSPRTYTIHHRTTDKQGMGATCQSPRPLLCTECI